MGLLQQAQADIARITSDTSGFGSPITFTDPSGFAVTINGRANKIHLGVDTDGNESNFKKAYVGISESLLIAAGYTVRNTKGDVNMIDHKVNVTDSTGTMRYYKINAQFPDETIGFIVFHLEAYKQQ